MMGCVFFLLALIPEGDEVIIKMGGGYFYIVEGMAGFPIYRLGGGKWGFWTGGVGKWIPGTGIGFSILEMVDFYDDKDPPAVAAVPFYLYLVFPLGDTEQHGKDYYYSSLISFYWGLYLMSFIERNDEAINRPISLYAVRFEKNLRPGLTVGFEGGYIKMYDEFNHEIRKSFYAGIKGSIGFLGLWVFRI